MRKPKVSIIVALYNKEKNIEKCLKSLINQSLKEIEIIVVDDCSTDNSLNICTSFDDKRIITISNKKNMGIGYTRNLGIKKAQGEYIAFVDADDYVEKEMYERYYNYCVNNQIDLLNTNYNKVIDNKKVLFNVPEFNPTNINNNLNIINLINYGPCNKLFKRELIIDNNIYFDEKNKFEDMIFIAKSIRSANNIGYLKDAYYNYVIHDSSETTTIDERTFDIFDVMKQVDDVYINFKNTDELVYLNIVEITRYMLKQKHQKTKKLRDRFIDKGYSFLSNLNPNWINNKYYKNESYFKRIVKNNKTIMKIYCKI